MGRVHGQRCSTQPDIMLVSDVVGSMSVHAHVPKCTLAGPCFCVLVVGGVLAGERTLDPTYFV